MNDTIDERETANDDIKRLRAELEQARLDHSAFISELWQILGIRDGWDNRPLGEYIIKQRVKALSGAIEAYDEATITEGDTD